MSDVKIQNRNTLASGKAMRVPCDQCRRRRVRCNGESPCDRCISAGLRCSHEYVPKRRGPKKGVGKVIAELKKSEGAVPYDLARPEFDVCPSTWSPSDESSRNSSSPTSFSSPSLPYSSWPDELRQGISPSALDSSHETIAEKCLNLFLEHIYAIKPVFYKPQLQAMLARSMTPHEKNVIYALCAMTATHMSGRPECIDGQGSWTSLARHFLEKCVAIRRSYDFIEDRSLFAVISSYFIFEAFFELDEQRKAWYHLQEALTLAQELGLDSEASYANLQSIEAHNLQSLTDSSSAIAIFRHKPLKLARAPEFPYEKLDYEQPDIRQSLLRLIRTFTPLDATFVGTWNQSDYDISTSEFSVSWIDNDSDVTEGDFAFCSETQKADILITQQWIRLIVWQSALRKGLLSSTARNPSMTFKYPLQIANTLLKIINSIPKSSIAVHGIGIFEKIFDIACSVIDVANTHSLDFENNASHYFGSNPLDAFMRILSATPSSHKIYASALEVKAASQPEIFRSVLRAGLRSIVSQTSEVDLRNLHPSFGPSIINSSITSMTTIPAFAIGTLVASGPIGLSNMYTDVWEVAQSNIEEHIDDTNDPNLAIA